MNDNIIRKIDHNTSYFVLTTINRTNVRCEVRYTFAHGLTDEVLITLPINTRLFIEVSTESTKVYANVISDKKQVREIVETTLEGIFHEMREDYPTLCECFRIFLSKEDFKNYKVTDATESDLLDAWFN